MVRRGRVVRPARRSNASGFTLFEVLAALAVLGIATGIFASLFIASMNLGHLNQSRTIAASLAEEQLVLIRNHPQGFTWPDFNALAAGEFGPVTPADPAGTALSAADAPAAMPTDKTAFQRDENFYAQFACGSYARIPDADAGYVEIAAVIYWTEKGRPQSITLTSALPRTILEGGQ